MHVAPRRISNHIACDWPRGFSLADDIFHQRPKRPCIQTCHRTVSYNHNRPSFRSLSLPFQRRPKPCDNVFATGCTFIHLYRDHPPPLRLSLLTALPAVLSDFLLLQTIWAIFEAIITDSKRTPSLFTKSRTPTPQLRRSGDLHCRQFIRAE